MAHVEISCSIIRVSTNPSAMLRPLNGWMDGFSVQLFSPWIHILAHFDRQCSNGYWLARVMLGSHRGDKTKIFVPKPHYKNGRSKMYWKNNQKRRSVYGILLVFDMLLKLVPSASTLRINCQSLYFPRWAGTSNERREALSLSERASSGP